MKRLYNDSFQVKYKDERLKFCENLKRNYTTVGYTSLSTNIKKNKICLHKIQKNKKQRVILYHGQCFSSIAIIDSID